MQARFLFCGATAERILAARALAGRTKQLDSSASAGRIATEWLIT
jgi:hypothetical protein